MRLLVFCAFLYLVGVTRAAPTTNTSNTTTSDSLKAPSFTTRTLWTIISSSVITLFACIYSAIHINIPSPKDSPYRILRRRLGIMIMALIAPELMVTWAMRQWFSACYVTRRFEKSGYPSVLPEQAQSEEKEPEAPEQHENRFLRRLLIVLATRILSVLMFLRRFPAVFARWIQRSVKAYFSEQSEDDAWTKTHSFFVLMGGFMLYVDGEPYLTLRPDSILKLMRDRCIDAPTLTANQIHDRSKGNAISKGLIMLQVAWFIMQLITRAIYHLETTQLEVGTLAFAVLNFITYAVWWNKPLNVQRPHPVYWKSTTSRPEDHVYVPESDQVAVWEILFLVIRPIDELIKLEYSDREVLVCAGLLMATIFGGIHCMAWFFAFHTYQEQVLWRMSAVAITCTPWLSLFTLYLLGVLDTPDAVSWPVCVLYAMLYITARAILLVLMFTTLRNLPPDAYKTVSWITLVPHL
ncbi:uncharacterized protein BJ212DRAFT_599553 [Suillus subaureus]|uniref:Uncharacterized protein n=1 Tax=Suillus subaureus TaxID=48587 RepID=A0A9P7E2K2_9AGAM|nr:uncharacterized protein BJ212DRAFT_599553 [Suillus subaureus]KAG1809713.1 hypothetical protein BJ212DRAFT_599553 [Suillus subaureus]